MSDVSKPCTKDIKHCDHLKRLVVVMEEYNKNDILSVKISDVINDYLHIMHAHVNDLEFEFVANAFRFCDIETCAMFARNYRITINEEPSIGNVHLNDIVYAQIMNKIHCYFQHCYDIGNRLSINDKESIHHVCDEQLQDDDDTKKPIADDDIFSTSINDTKILKMNQILSRKRKRYRKLCNDNRENKKYNQLFVNNDEQKHNMETNKFSFGYQFKYGYDAEDDLTDSDDDERVSVSPKYSSFKQELTENNVSFISMQQFNTEYKKSQLHFESAFCKENFRPLPITDEDDESRYNKELHINMECLLSLMIYCNYTELQYQLSKTYRIDNGEKHSNFYYLGKYLKMSVDRFGTNIYEGTVNNFYHGIGQQLLLPQYVSRSEDHSFGVNIHCPLSTSSAIEVAVNFTNDNNGIIIEFCNYVEFGGEVGSIKHFSVSWLSDYANESEYLFIQNTFYEPLEITDIVHAPSGCHYRLLLEALKNIQEIISGDWIGAVSHSMSSLIIAVFRNQLSLKLCTYKSIGTLPEYGKGMCSTYFSNTINIVLDYKDINEHHPLLVKLLFHSETRWIDINIIHALFPNIRHIEVRNASLCTSLLDVVVNDLKNNSVPSTLKTIEICHENSSLTAKEVINNYTSIFRKLNMFIAMKENKFNCDFNHCDKLCFHLCNMCEFALHLMDNINNYYMDTKDEIIGLLDKLIKERLLNRNTPFTAMKHSVNQELFDNHCVLKKRMWLNWETAILKKNSYLIKLFYDLVHERIKIDVIIALFPNIECIHISKLSVCSETINVILESLMNRKANLNRIEICDIKQNADVSTPLYLSAITTKYHHKFKALNFEIRASVNTITILRV